MKSKATKILSLMPFILMIIHNILSIAGLLLPETMSNDILLYYSNLYNSLIQHNWLLFVIYILGILGTVVIDVITKGRYIKRYIAYPMIILTIYIGWLNFAAAISRV